MKKPPIKDFTDLVAWQVARELRKAIYEITRKMPPEEKYVLVAQIRRAAISITANLAEGFGRFSYQEHVQFCRNARGSAFEVRDHLIALLDEGFLSQTEWRNFDKHAQRAIQLVNGYIRATKARQQLPNAE